MHEGSIKPLITAIALTTTVVLAGTVAYLAQDLPADVAVELHYPAAGFQFAFGSGHPVDDQMIIDAYADGHALLSSGPVKIQAEHNKVLRYTWLPSRLSQEAVFFWRQQGVSDKVAQIALPIAGTHLLDLSEHAQWRDEISEFGFFMLGKSNSEGGEDHAVIGPVTLLSDRLGIRIQLLWQGWSSFENWSQQSVNFLRGGASTQVLSLPLLIISWLLLSLFLFWLVSRRSSKQSPRHVLKIMALFFLAAWMLLDIRWTSNNIRHIRLALPTLWHGDEQHRLASDLDGEIYQYIERLKNDVLGAKTSRILIIGDQGVPDYFLQRAKYHLLPHSANATRSFSPRLLPETLDFVIYFGQPESINGVQGWNPAWQQALKRLNTNPLATVYKIRKP